VIRAKWVVVAVAMAGLVSVPWWGPWTLGHFRFFAVQRVEVDGARYLAPATIVAALALKPGASVWSNRTEMERRVGALAGVRSASVSRHLPYTLVVAVVEVEPVALAEGPAGLVAVDESGRPLPYDPVVVPVDVPVVERADATDSGSARDGAGHRPRPVCGYRAARAAAGGAVVLELEAGRLRVRDPARSGGRAGHCRRYGATSRRMGRSGWSWTGGSAAGWWCGGPTPARPGQKAAA